MTDKELFEKTEKTFNLNKKNPILENVFKKGNFKSLLENTSPIGSNYGGNTVSAARAAGRGVAKTGGAFAKGLGALGRFAREVIPGTRASRMRSAEARKAEAQARQEEIKARQAQANLMGGKNTNGSTANMDEALKKVYADPQFKEVYDKAMRKEPLTAPEQVRYDAGMKKVDDLRKGVDIEKGKEEAQKTELSRVGEEKLIKLDGAAGNLAAFLRDEDNLQTKILFQKYVLQTPPTTPEELIQLANGLSKYFYTDENNPRNKPDFVKLKKYLAAEEKLKNLEKGAPLLNAIGIKTVQPKKSVKQGDISAEDQKNINAIQAMADNAKIKFQNQLTILNKQADKFKVGDIVVGIAGGRHKVTGKDGQTGTVIIKSQTKQQKTSKRFAKDLEKEQTEIPLNGESFEQIVKRYR